MPNDEQAQSEVSRQAVIESFRNRPESETGWDRVRELYTIKHLRYVDFECSPELSLVGDAFRTSTLLGFMTGVLNHWKQAKETFIRQNKETKFVDKKDYMREAYKYKLKYSGRHGVQFGLRFGLFTGLYCLGTVTVAIYNNKLSAKEYIASGIVTGALWQSSVGLRGAIVGGAVGGLLSVFAGFAAVKCLEYQEQDLATLRYQLHSERLEAWESRDRLMTKTIMDELIEDAKHELEEEKQAS